MGTASEMLDSEEGLRKGVSVGGEVRGEGLGDPGEGFVLTVKTHRAATGARSVGEGEAEVPV